MSLLELKGYLSEKNSFMASFIFELSPESSVDESTFKFMLIL